MRPREPKKPDRRDGDENRSGVNAPSVAAPTRDGGPSVTVESPVESEKPRIPASDAENLYGVAPGITISAVAGLWSRLVDPSMGVDEKTKDLRLIITPSRKLRSVACLSIVTPCFATPHTLMI